MTARLILAIISTMLEEAAIVVIVLWGLPRLGVNMPLPGLAALMVVWAAYSVVTYRIGSRALRKEPVASLPGMTGCMGEVVSPLVPEGLVKIKGELWMAKSESEELQSGQKVTVVAQDGLKLLVRGCKSTDTLETTR